MSSATGIHYYSDLVLARKTACTGRAVFAGADSNPAQRGRPISLKMGRSAVGRRDILSGSNVRGFSR